MRRFVWILVVVIVLVLLIFGGTAIRLYTDWLWFKDLGYTVIFSRIIWARIGLAAVSAVLFFGIVYFNLRLVRRLAPPPTRRYAGVEEELRERFGAFARRGLGILLFAGTAVVALMVGLQAATHWQDWLLFQNATTFGVKDPIFAKDVGFYVFRLPFWNYIYGWFFFTILAAAVASAVLHYADEGIDFFANTPRFAPGVKAHLGVLVALLFFLKAVGYRLGMYSLTLSRHDLFTGANYTDMHARLPGLWILLVLAVLAGVVVLANIYRRGIWLAAGALAGLIVVSIIVGGIYPAAVQQFSVTPNELEKERPYIARAIGYTRLAFRLNPIKSRPFDYVPDLTADQIARNQAAIQNLRLWNYEPLKAAYNQLQVFQQYYDFNDVDIDRYTVNDQYRQVMLSARELKGPPANADTWVNRYTRYTHGYAYAMSPVNEVSSEGMPDYFVYDVPVKTPKQVELNVPQVYFGEMSTDYVIVNTKRKELDYPLGSTEIETTYDAKSGPVIGSFARKLAFAIRFGDINILLSDDIQPESRVLFRRNIGERARTLFPFLLFDNDPYLVAARGRLYWFHDAYTATDNYPYSEPLQIGFQNANAELSYIRNSVKLVTDAYTGKVEAFVADPEDPVIGAYARMFPGVFKPMSAMPPEFLAHRRYPEDLFKIQAHVYGKYHMKTPSAFYSRTDLWGIPDVPAAGGDQSSDQAGSTQMEPYYVITRLPRSSVDEFILIVPLIRPGKNNMVAWMAAKCDPEDYGKLIAYEFPRGQTVFGPRQVMGRADQDTQISGQITLWSQAGSRVVRGSLLAIPIENSILYVEPLYLASTTTQIPEFKRVIISLGDRLAMEPTVQEALTAVVGKGVMPPAPSGAPAPTGPQPGPPTAAPAAPPDVRALVDQANEQLKRAQDAQRRGDWAAYGQEQEALQKTLAELRKRAGGR